MTNLLCVEVHGSTEQLAKLYQPMEKFAPQSYDMQFEYRRVAKKAEPA